MLGGDADEIEGEGEVARMLGLDGARDVVPGQALDGERVHQSFEVGGEPDRIGRRGRHPERHLVAERQEPAVDGAGPGLDQAGKDQPALEGGDRRAQDLLAALAGRRRQEVELGLVGLAERHHPGEQRGRAAFPGQDRRQRPGGAAGRQVEGDRGEPERPAGEVADEAARQQRLGQGIEEGQPRRNGEDVAVPAHGRVFARALGTALGTALGAALRAALGAAHGLVSRIR